MSDTISATGAINASQRREPVENAFAATRPLHAERVREAAPASEIEHEKKTDEATAAALSSTVSDINQSLKMASIGVQFELDQEAKTVVTKVIDVESGELIRQVPSEEMVRISKVLGQLQGFLLSQKA